MPGLGTQGDPWSYFDEVQVYIVHQLIQEREHVAQEREQLLLRRIARLEGFVNYMQNFLPGGLKLEAADVMQEAHTLYAEYTAKAV